MSTWRERQQLAKRSRQGRRRRTKPVKPVKQRQEPDPQPEDPHIGFFAREGRELLRHDEAVVVIGARSVMQQTLKRQRRTAMTICDVTFDEIAMGLVEGAAFCFDDQAYARFLEPAREAGLPLQDQDRGEPAAPGEPAIRIQLDFAGGQHDHRSRME